MTVKQGSSGAVWSERPGTRVSPTVRPVFLVADGTPNGYVIQATNDDPDALLLDDGSGGFEVVPGSDPGALAQLYMLEIGIGSNKVKTYT